MTAKELAKNKARKKNQNSIRRTGKSLSLWYCHYGMFPQGDGRLSYRKSLRMRSRRVGGTTKWRGLNPVNRN